MSNCTCGAGCCADVETEISAELLDRANALIDALIELGREQPKYRFALTDTPTDDDGRQDD